MYVQFGDWYCTCGVVSGGISTGLPSNLVLFLMLSVRIMLLPSVQSCCCQCNPIVVKCNSAVVSAIPLCQCNGRCCQCNPGVSAIDAVVSGMVLLSAQSCCCQCNPATVSAILLLSAQSHPAMDAAVSAILLLLVQWCCCQYGAGVSANYLCVLVNFHGAPANQMLSVCFRLSARTRPGSGQ